MPAHSCTTELCNFVPGNVFNNHSGRTRSTHGSLSHGGAPFRTEDPLRPLNPTSQNVVQRQHARASDLQGSVGLHPYPVLGPESVGRTPHGYARAHAREVAHHGDALRASSCWERMRICLDVNPKAMSCEGLSRFVWKWRPQFPECNVFLGGDRLLRVPAWRWLNCILAGRLRAAGHQL